MKLPRTYTAMKAILKCSGRIVEVEPIEGDPGHMIVFGTVFRRTIWDAMGYRPVHVVPKEKLEIVIEQKDEAPDQPEFPRIGTCSACAKWFADQQQVEKRINDQLSTGGTSPEMWGRVLAKVGIQATPPRRRRWPIAVAVLTAAALVVLAVLIVQIRGRSSSTELARTAAEWHEQRMRGNVQPDFVSSSDQDVDRYLKAKVPFRVHCPPRSDVNFKVQGAGVCYMKDQRQAAYIVGHVGKASVTILVLDRASLEGFPPDGFHHSKEGSYQIASGVIADNVVVVSGTASPDVLERLLRAYGSYHEG